MTCKPFARRPKHVGLFVRFPEPFCFVFFLERIPSSLYVIVLRFAGSAVTLHPKFSAYGNPANAAYEIACGCLVDKTARSPEGLAAHGVHKIVHIFAFNYLPKITRHR
jgi:hypothetical protein